MIGSARISENGTINGAKGDQTTREVATQEYYKHSKGWVVLRAKNDKVANLLAEGMEKAVANDNIGYGQNDRESGYQEASKYGFDFSQITTKCNIDCSKLVQACCRYAGIEVGDFYTGNERSVLLQTGAFTEVDVSTEDDSYLRRGDILVTKTKGHTAINLTDGVNELGHWEKSGSSWTYRKSNGELAKSEWVRHKGRWYYIGEFNKMLTGRVKIDNEIFYLATREDVGEDIEGCCMITNDRYALVDPLTD